MYMDRLNQCSNVNITITTGHACEMYTYVCSITLLGYNILLCCTTIPMISRLTAGDMHKTINSTIVVHIIQFHVITFCIHTDNTNNFVCTFKFSIIMINWLQAALIIII